MIDIFIEATPTTPLVRIDSEAASIVIEGKSSPADSLGFYHPLIQKIHNLFLNCEKTIEVNLAFRYFNTSSSKCLFDFFKMLKGLEKMGRELKINWHFEADDEDMMETGEDYADLLDLPFNFVEVEEIEDAYLKQAV